LDGAETREQRRHRSRAERDRRGEMTKERRRKRNKYMVT
jgi:hypothetical protein